MMSDDLTVAVASLNDIVAELVCGLASGERPTKGWAYVAVKQLAEHSRALGVTPQIDESVIAGWEDES